MPAPSATSVRTASRRYAGPEEVAKGHLFLCSDEVSFVNGHTLVADAG